MLAKGTRVSSLLGVKTQFHYKSTLALPAQDVLKKFYRVVHPDLFSSHPDRRNTNTQSFALLQNYLEFIKNKSNEPLNSFNLSFYSKNKEEVATIKVNPPNIDAPRTEKEKHLHRTLSHLFNECGFQSGPFDTTGYGDPPPTPERYARPGETTLVKFLLSNTGILRKPAKETKNSPELNRLSVKLAEDYKIKQFEFRVAHHYFLSSSDRSRQRRRILERFSEIISSLKVEKGSVDNLKDCSIVFGKRSGIDSEGSLNLPVFGDDNQWKELLSFYSSDRAKVCVKMHEQRIELQNKVAQKFGVAKVYCDTDIEELPEYEEFLKRVLYQSIEEQEKKNYPKLTLRFTSATKGDESTTGTIALPITLTPLQVYEAINSLGNVVQKEFSTIKKYRAGLKERLKLENLTYDAPPSITSEQLMECFQRLAQGASKLTPFTENLKFHITSDYGKNEETKTLAIRWDYLVD